MDLSDDDHDDERCDVPPIDLREPSIHERPEGIVGFLNKYTGSGGFRRRWFQLRGDVLYYFPTQTDTEPKGCFWLRGASLVKNLRLARRDPMGSLVTRGRRMGTKYTFVIRKAPSMTSSCVAPTSPSVAQQRGQTWELCADTAMDLEAWLAVLEAAGAEREPDAEAQDLVEEENYKFANAIDSLAKKTDQVDSKQVGRLARAAAAKVGKGLLYFVPGGETIGKGISAMADIADDMDDQRPAVTPELVERIALAITRAQLPADHPLKNSAKLEADPTILEALQNEVELANNGEPPTVEVDNDGADDEDTGGLPGMGGFSGSVAVGPIPSVF